MVVYTRNGVIIDAGERMLGTQPWLLADSSLSACVFPRDIVTAIEVYYSDKRPTVSNFEAVRLQERIIGPPPTTTSAFCIQCQCFSDPTMLQEHEQCPVLFHFHFI